MYKLALKLLKKEANKAKNLCFCIGMTITSCMIFLHFLLNPFFYESQNYLFENDFFIIALIGFFLVFLCILLMINACDYYIKVKSREMGLLLLSGLSWVQITMYNLIQLSIIVIIGSFFGFVLFFIIHPIVQYLLSIRMNIALDILYINVEVFKQCFALIFTLLFVVLTVNIGHIYKSSISELLVDKSILHLKKIKDYLNFLRMFMYLFIFLD